mgnify:CR=1 FL=1|tara:strand:+ start:10848 stop:11744 length:897 start_codon:yes stop_codon:yes gene_type:complete
MSLSKEAKTSSNYVDVLDEDKPISGQKFVCVSFISPEKVLKSKDLFLFNEFIKTWDFSKTLEKYQHFFNFLSVKYNLEVSTLNEEFQEFVKDQKENLLNTTVEDDYKNFLDENEEILINKFNIDNNFQTNTRGIKIRGVYSTQEEAESRCKMLREIDPNHDVFVGPVGLWMPWDPEAYKTGKVEYLEQELNELMHNKIDNEKDAKLQFEKRIKEAKEKAMEENKKLAEENDNVLTQVLNDDGKLVNVREVDYDAIPDEMAITEVSEAENQKRLEALNLKEELFEKANLELNTVKDKSD